MEIIEYIFKIFLLYPLGGIAAIFTFMICSYASVAFLKFFKMKPTHYNYIDYTKVKKYSEKDHIQSFLDGDIVKNIEKLKDKFPENLTEKDFYYNGLERATVYRELIKKNRIKNGIIAYILLVIIGAIFVNLYCLIFDYVSSLNNSFFISIYEEGERGLSILVYLMVFGALTIFYYLLDFIYSFSISEIFKSEIEEKIREDKGKQKKDIELYKSKLK